MEFFSVVEKRQSVRAFKKKEVEQEKLQKILETANSAPSAGNFQSYEIVVARNSKKKLAAASNQGFLAEAPIVLVICSNEKRSEYYGMRGKELYCINDASIAAAYIQLAATALGLATVWVGAFDEDAVRKIIKAPVHVKPIAMLPLGYPAEEPKKTRRRLLKDLVHEETL